MDDGQVEKIVKEIIKRRIDMGEEDFIPHDDVQFALWDPVNGEPPEDHCFDMQSAHSTLKHMGYEVRYRPFGYEKTNG